MPRVCILTTVHDPFDVRVFHKEARSLAHAGYDVCLLAPAEKAERVDGVDIVPIGGDKKGRLHRTTVLWWRALRKAVAAQADVYHFHDPELIPLGLLLKVFTRARVVYDIHEDYPQQILSKAWIPTGFHRPVAAGMALLERLAAGVFDGLAAATPDIASRFPPSKTMTMHNFPRLEELAISGGDVLPYAERPNRVVYLGGISTIRGAFEMVKAVELTKFPVELMVAGKFESEKLKNELSAFPGWKRTRFLGWLNRSEVREVLGQSRLGLVLLHPLLRHKRSLPNKLFEYMAAGIPFVASDFPLWRELGEGAGLFVDPLDPQAIAEAIDWLLAHPDEAEAMGRRGRELVSKKYNWDLEAHKLLQLYERLLS